MEAHTPEEELREPRNYPACGCEAEDTRGAAGGEDAHAATVQCEYMPLSSGTDFLYINTHIISTDHERVQLQP